MELMTKLRLMLEGLDRNVLKRQTWVKSTANRLSNISLQPSDGSEAAEYECHPGMPSERAAQQVELAQAMLQYKSSIF